MQFNSISFLFVFLPLALAGYYALLNRVRRHWIHLYIFLVSLVFYAWTGPLIAMLLLASTGVNYVAGLLVEQRHEKGLSARPYLWLGVIGNLAVLGYFKYSGFFIHNLNAIFRSDYRLGTIILPLAISFYTFQQIAFLIDISRGSTKTRGILEYAAFVFYFPRLTAGPLVHYADIMPQFSSPRLGRRCGWDLIIGLAIFAVGLFKKTVIAASAGSFVDPTFNSLHPGAPLNITAAWTAAVAYTIQVYFDFSGYSDMAIGISRMFGIILPPNFHSPLRAPSIIDFWRRWHMSLQQLIVAYVYQPLVLPLTRWSMAQRFGKWPTFLATVGLPSFILFAAVGFWHGAAWTYILFGLIHGGYLTVNEFWRAIRRKARRKSPPGPAPIVFYHMLTALCIVVANVMFRAAKPGDALMIWRGMLNFTTSGKLALPETFGVFLTTPIPLFAFALIIVSLFPNTQQLFQRYRPVLGWSKWRDVARPVVNLAWRPTGLWSVWTGVVLFFGIIYIMREQSVFIYFNF